MARVTIRHVFPVATMKLLAENVINGQSFTKKKEYKSELIKYYDSNDGCDILKKMTEVGFDSKKLAAAHRMRNTLSKLKKKLTSGTPKSVHDVAKALSIPLDDTVDLAITINELEGRIIRSDAANSQLIDEYTKLKTTYDQLDKQYAQERKPVLKEWRTKYRECVNVYRSQMDKNERLLELRAARKGERGETAKELRAQILALETELQAEIDAKLVDVSSIAETLGVDKAVAERYAVVFRLRKCIDSLSSSSIRVAKLGEVLSFLAEKEVQFAAAHAKSVFGSRLSSDSAENGHIKILLSDLKGLSGSQSAAGSLLSCSPTLSLIEQDKPVVYSESASVLATHVRNAAAEVTHKLTWDKPAREALCVVVYESVTALVNIFKMSITGNAKTISYDGVKNTLATYFTARGINPASFETEINEIFAK